MNDLELFDIQCEIIEKQARIINELYQALAQHVGADDSGVSDIRKNIAETENLRGKWNLP